MNKRIVIAGLMLIVLGIVFGAFGTHALKSHLSAEKLISFETGVRYQMYHGLGMLMLGLNADKIKKGLTRAFQLLLSGTILFSGSIYLLSLQVFLGEGVRLLGPVTPLGGILMIIGWLYLLVSIFNVPKR